mmetsp:Transcript_20730/g.70529  ORF Transcript_20730/g.70529 Transcript_20730/m.70529 type:complete len:238 (+) Transcript_20730:1057-1770(+)
MSLSSISSMAFSSISLRERSSTLRPCTMLHLPPLHVTGKEYTSPLGMPYEPSDATPMDVHVPAGVPFTQSRMWSTAELAAESAEERPRILMISAPRCRTHFIMSPSRYASSPTAARMAAPPTAPWFTSGYCVALWLPQMETFLTLETGAPNFSDTWPSARLWSSRVRHVMLSAGTSGQFCLSTSALVLAGFATTSTLTPGLASFREEPKALNMETFLPMTSLRSMPALRGNPPTRIA